MASEPRAEILSRVRRGEGSELQIPRTFSPLTRLRTARNDKLLVANRQDFENSSARSVSIVSLCDPSSDLREFALPPAQVLAES